MGAKVKYKSQQQKQLQLIQQVRNGKKKAITNSSFGHQFIVQYRKGTDYFSFFECPTGRLL